MSITGKLVRNMTDSLRINAMQSYLCHYKLKTSYDSWLHFIERLQF